MSKYYTKKAFHNKKRRKKQTRRKQMNKRLTRKRLSKITRKHHKQTRRIGGSNKEHITIIPPNINADEINKYLEEHNCIEEENKKECQKAKSHGIKSMMKMNYESNISNEWVSRYLFNKLIKPIINHPLLSNLDISQKKIISIDLIKRFVLYTKTLTKKQGGASKLDKFIDNAIQHKNQSKKLSSNKKTNIKLKDYNNKNLFKQLVKDYIKKLNWHDIYKLKNKLIEEDNKTSIIANKKPITKDELSTTLRNFGNMQINNNEDNNSPIMMSGDDESSDDESSDDESSDDESSDYEFSDDESSDDEYSVSTTNKKPDIWDKAVKQAKLLKEQSKQMPDSKQINKRAKLIIDDKRKNLTNKMKLVLKH